MASFVLIDLCFPAAQGEPRVVAEAAARAGLQAVVYARDCGEDQPDPETISDIARDNALATLYPAVSVRGEGFGYVVLVPQWEDSPLLGVLGEMADGAAIEAAAHEAGGCAIPMCPRQGPDGTVLRCVQAPSDLCRVGTVAHVAGATHLGRDLDVEDTAASRRRVLSGTGPYGSMEDIGRFATLFQVHRGDLSALLGALKQGSGLALEVAQTGRPVAKKKRRRRRNRKPRDESQGAAESSDD